MNTRIKYIKNIEGDYLLPFQYYDEFNLISIPTIGKRPIIKDWPNKIKTIPPSDISYNTALLTGKINDIIVVDIDIKDDGLKLWDELVKEHGEINTPTVKSGQYGKHLYFKYSSKIHSSIKLKIDNKKYGIDIRSNGNLITVPPSSDLESGDKYKWLISLDDTSIKKMPKWLENFILKYQV
jgi:bifunctional DNA primase/polymerase-like protein